MDGRQTTHGENIFSARRIVRHNLSAPAPYWKKYVFVNSIKYHFISFRVHFPSMTFTEFQFEDSIPMRYLTCELMCARIDDRLPWNLRVYLHLKWITTEYVTHLFEFLIQYSNAQYNVMKQLMIHVRIDDSNNLKYLLIHHSNTTVIGDRQHAIHWWSRDSVLLLVRSPARVLPRHVIGRQV